MIRLRKTFIVFSMLIINIICSCAPYEWDGFINKQQIINAVKENISDLNILTNEIYNMYINKEFYSCYIDNRLFKSNKDYSYKTPLANKIFNIMRIDYIGIYYNSNYKKHSVEYIVRNKFGTVCGYYYSFNNDKNYYYFDNDNFEQLKELGQYVELNNITIYFNSRHGWYTEKICDNWYYFEQDFEYLNFIKYVYDDIVNMNPPNKFYQENKQFFEKYNPHNESSKNKVSNQ